MIFLCHRHELQSLSRENELMQDEINRQLEELAKEQKQRRKIERVLGDSAGAIRNMLTVSVQFCVQSLLTKLHVVHVAVHCASVLKMTVYYCIYNTLESILEPIAVLHNCIP